MAAKTDNEGYFCKSSCLLRNKNCDMFFTSGCRAAGMPRKPNTLYQDVDIYEENTGKILMYSE